MFLKKVHRFFIISFNFIFVFVTNCMDNKDEKHDFIKNKSYSEYNNSNFNKYFSIKEKEKKIEFFDNILKNTKKNTKAISNLVCSIDFYNYKNIYIYHNFDKILFDSFIKDTNYNYLPLFFIDKIKLYCWSNSVFIKDNLIFKYLSNSSFLYIDNLNVFRKKHTKLFNLKKSYSNALKNIDVDEIIYLYPIMLQLPRLVNIYIKNYIENKYENLVIKLIKNLKIKQNFLDHIFYYAIINSSLSIVKYLIEVHDMTFDKNFHLFDKKFKDILFMSLDTPKIELWSKELNIQLIDEFKEIEDEVLEDCIKSYKNYQKQILSYIDKIEKINSYINNRTILHIVAKLEKIDLFELLVAKGANPFLKTLDTGDTILNIAAENYNYLFIEYLSREKKYIKLGQIKNNLGYNPLFKYIEDQTFDKYFQFDIFFLFVKVFNCNCNTKTEDGKIFMNFCISNIDYKNDFSLKIWFKVIKFIVNNSNVDFNIEDGNGNNTFDLLRSIVVPKASLDNEDINIFGGPSQIMIYKLFQEKLEDQEKIYNTEEEALLYKKHVSFTKTPCMNCMIL